MQVKFRQNCLPLKNDSRHIIRMVFKREGTCGTDGGNEKCEYKFRRKTSRDDTTWENAA